MSGIPLGGATEISPGTSSGGDSIDRATFMEQMLQAYLSCQWSSACVDVIARTCTAGGVQAVPISADLENSELPEMPPPVREVMDLLTYVNPYDDIRQIMRGAITDSLVYGDSFTEVVWLMGKPVSLWSLDPATMTILSDEHGILRGYHQKMETGREVTFAPHEVIHVKFDSPGGGLYGMSPTQKNILPITSWLFTAALVKETMKRGDPIRAHVDWPLALPPSEMKRFQEQFQVRNLGARNIGNLFETKGGAHVQELGANQVKNWLDVLQQRRDEILSGYGVPPSKVGVIESGNLGGGTGTSQDRMFRVNTCGPIEEALLEKFTFALLYQAYGVTDWRLKFGEVDWRDDKVIEDIRDVRVRNGSWTINRYRSDIGEPSIKGGDDPILVDRQNLVLWADMSAMSTAVVAATHAKSNPLDPGSPATPASQATPADKTNTGSPNQQATALKQLQQATGLQTEAAGHSLDERWQAFYASQRKQLLEDANVN
jgi:hypothetical protein